MRLVEWGKKKENVPARLRHNAIAGQPSAVGEPGTVHEAVCPTMRRAVATSAMRAAAARSPAARLRTDQGKLAGSAVAHHVPASHAGGEGHRVVRNKRQQR